MLLNTLKYKVLTVSLSYMFLSSSTSYCVLVIFKLYDKMFRLLLKWIQNQLHCLKIRHVTRNNIELWIFFVCFDGGFLAFSSLNIFDFGLTELLAVFQMFHSNVRLTYWKIKGSTQQKILLEWTNSFSMRILAWYRLYKLNSVKKYKLFRGYAIQIEARI